MAASSRKEMSVFSLDYDGLMDQFAYVLLNYGELEKVFKTPGFRGEDYFTKAWYENWENIFYSSCPLIQLIKQAAENKEVSKLVLINGSNRQDLRLDLFNRYTPATKEPYRIDTGSSFYFLTVLYERLKKSISPNLELNQFLMADLYNGTEHGYTFKQAIAQDFARKLFHRNSPAIANYYSAVVENKEFPKTRFDDSKITLLYAQIHKLAVDNPNENIVFNFVDDREDILKCLQEAFERHPEVLPKNVKLNLIHYIPVYNDLTVPFKKIITIQGQGVCDTNYSVNVQKLFDAVYANEPLNQKVDVLFKKINFALGAFKEMIGIRKDRVSELSFLRAEEAPSATPVSDRKGPAGPGPGPAAGEG